MRLVRSMAIAAAASIIALGLAAPGAALAQKFPERVVRIINPYPPGGSADITGRVFAQKLSEVSGGQFIIENRTGAGGNVGAEAVARSAADGYTLLYAALGPVAINNILYGGTLAFDPVKDFVPIAVGVRTPIILIANPKLPVKNVQDLIALAKKQPGKLTFGSAGIGSVPHLTGEMFKSMANVDMIHVPYKGTGPAMSDLIGGHIDIMFDLMPAAIQQIRADKVRALGSAGPSRPSALSDLPTIAEQGVKGFDSSSWFALVAPVKTPPEVVSQLRALSVKALADPAVAKRFAELGSEVGTADEKAVREFLQGEIDKWSKVIKDAGIKVK